MKEIVCILNNNKNRHYSKLYLPIAFFFLFFSAVSAQEDQGKADSLKQLYLNNDKAGKEKLQLLSDLSFHENKDLKKAIEYADELIKLAGQMNDLSYQRIGYFNKGTKKRKLGELEEALAAYLRSVEIARKMNSARGEVEGYSGMADTYAVANNAKEAKRKYNQAVSALRKAPLASWDDSILFASVLLNTGDAFRRFHSFDSALIYFKEAKTFFDRTNHQQGIGYCLGNIGMVYASTGKDALAEKNMNEAIRILEKEQVYEAVCEYLTSIAYIQLNRGDTAKALTNTAKSLRLAEQGLLKEQMRDASLKLSELYEQTGNTKEALKNYKRYIAYRESLNNGNISRNMDSLRHSYEMRQQEIELNQKTQTERNLRIYFSIILGLTLIILGILLKNTRNRKKAYRILSLQKQETEIQKAKAEEALNELQTTQKQLIQSAKMASLGELTAGIAHEIQNPLNFVNNFSDLSIELLEEFKDNATKSNAVFDMEDTGYLIQNLSDNLLKVRDHGRRADSIVKGMLQHSRVSIGKKEPTNINALAAEYLRLSYHGIRARDKNFTANFSTLFDDSIGEIEVIPQDIGRVLLNLYNNAFYAVMEKQKKENRTYEPFVTVMTKRINNAVSLSVKDNGTGIPQHLLDKIFQPFFTTKPAGEGTGLGLSLSYDVVKAHGGELTVETIEGAFTEFVIKLPVRSKKALPV